MTEEVPEEVWEFPKIGSKKQRAIYTPESMTHPAKMDTYLTRRLIKEYTKVGDVVADPMAGVGTTGVEAVLLGRHAILVDIESKFTELCKKNLENVEKIFGKASFKPKLGKAVVITGDSRRLSTLLQQHADAIVTSPPYSQSVGHQGGLDKSDFKHGCRYRERYPKSKENIGNLKHDETVDTILTSPPYSEQLQAKADYEKRKERLAKLGHTNKTHGLLRGQKSTSKVIGGDERYSENPDNIGNLKHGQISTIITSPPYANQEVGKGIRKNRWNKIKDREGFKGRKEWKAGTPSHYSDSKENIGNLPIGRIDTIVTSPPYSESLQNKHDWDAENKRFLEKTKDKNRKGRQWVYARQGDQYSEDENNIGNLKHGSIDIVLTSPPFAEAVHGRGIQGRGEYIKKMEEGLDARYKGKVCGNAKLGKSLKTDYPENPDNIANIPYGEVDIILTSPPYADIHQCPTNTGLTEFFRKQLEQKGYIEWNGKRYTEAEWRAMNHGRIDGRSTRGVKKDAKYSENPQNIGNLPHTENVDVILTSPPYVNAVHDTLEKRNKWKEKQLHEAKKGLPVGYSENPENIGNIKEQGEVDVIITSPPYEATFNAKQHTLSGIAKRDPTFRREVGGYGQNEANIGNLRRGKDGVDAILTSPPYAQSLSNKSGGMKGERNLPNRELSAKGDPQQYSANPENVGNLAYSDEELDEIIKRLREHGRTDAKAGGPFGRSLAHPYSPDPANIGNLPKGTVDTILTSPPYGHEATASKPTKLEMEGLFKMGHSKETPLTDEDYRAWELRSKGNIAKRKLFVRVPCKPEEAQFHDTRKGRKGTIWEWTKEVKVDLNNINVQQQKNQQKGKTETYLEAMYKVYNECYKVLKPPVDWCSCDE